MDKPKILDDEICQLKQASADDKLWGRDGFKSIGRLTKPHRHYHRNTSVYKSAWHYCLRTIECDARLRKGSSTLSKQGVVLE